MQITHKKIPTTLDKVGLNDWTDDHDISGLEGWELIEQKNLDPGTTTTTFSGLDGNVDKEYLITYELYITATGDNRYIKVKPNNISTNQKTSRGYSFRFGASYQIHDHIWLTSNGWSKSGYCFGRQRIRSSTGWMRVFQGVDSFTASDFSEYVNIYYTAWWKEMDTNITSLVVDITADSFKGKIRLYKKINPM